MKKDHSIASAVCLEMRRKFFAVKLLLSLEKLTKKLLN